MTDICRLKNGSLVTDGLRFDEIIFKFHGLDSLGGPRPGDSCDMQQEQAAKHLVKVENDLSKRKIENGWRHFMSHDDRNRTLSPNPPNCAVAVLEWDTRGMEARLSGRFWTVGVSGRSAVVVWSPR